MSQRSCSVREEASGSGLLERFFRQRSGHRRGPDATGRWEDACAVREKMTAIWIENKMLPIHGLKRVGSKPTATGSMQPLLIPYKFIVIEV